MPYESHDNESDFLNGLAHIAAVTEELDTTCVFVVGDINSDISDNRSLFGNHLQNFCQDQGFTLSSKQLLPPDSFTYISDA